MTVRVACSLLFIVALGVLLHPATSLAQAPTSFVVKSLEVNFEPTNVFLIETDPNGRLSRTKINYRLSSVPALGQTPKWNVTVAGVSTEGRKPAVVMLEDRSSEHEILHAQSIAIESGDLVDSLVVNTTRDEIAVLRKEYAQLEQKYQSIQNTVNQLKAKAAVVTRLSRLVEAQSTATNLARKLEGMNRDLANLELLIEVAKQQKVSARLANSEGPLSRAVKSLSTESVGAVKSRALQLSETKREAMQRVITQAQGLDLAALRREIQAYRSVEYDPNSINGAGAEPHDGPEF